VARVLLIFNPVAARTDARAVRAATRAFVRGGWDVEVVGTTRPGHAGDLAREGLADGATAVAVYGGDGTVLQAASGLAGTGVPLAILPGGTGNQLARNLGIPRDPAAAVRVMLAGAHRAVDIGRWTPDRGPAQVFGVACGAGYDAEIMVSTTRGMKRWLKTGAYLLQSLRSLRHLIPMPYRVTVDGVVTEGEAATVLVANCARIFPPYFPLRPSVRLDDGLLDVVALTADGLLEALRVLRQLARDRPDPRKVRHIQGRVIRLETTPPRAAQHDGEDGGVTPFTAEVLPGALEVFTPAGPVADRARDAEHRAARYDQDDAAHAEQRHLARAREAP
jgi:YegS/Rv2252/BmrU family lipid kinase